MKVGAVPYFNALPLCRYLPFPVRYEKPVVLDALMKSGELDVALLPTFSFLQSDYFPVFEGGLIQSLGAVESVLLFHKRDRPSLVNSVQLTKASRTSVNLFRVLYAFRWERNLAELKEVENNPDGILEIGDEALFFRKEGYKTCDLGAEWHEWTGLPFTFAFWCSRQPLKKEVIEVFRQAKNKGLKSIDDISAATAGWETERLRHYLTNSIRYEMLPRTLEGLRLFQDYCFRLGLIPQKREIA